MAKHAIKHNLSNEMAKKVADKAFETYSKKFADYQPTAKWTSSTRSEVSFNAKGIKLDGTIDLNPGEVVLDLKVPLLLRPFQSRALATIDSEIRSWIERAENGEIDN